MRKTSTLILGAMLCLGAGTEFPPPTSYRIDLRPLVGGAWRTYCDLIDEVAVTFASPADFYGEMYGRNATLSTGVSGQVQLWFNPPVSKVSAYMHSVEGGEDQPPVVTCYGTQTYEGPTGPITEPIAYSFGPGDSQLTYPAYGIYAGGTPYADEFAWSTCLMQSGVYWAITFTE